MKNNLQRIVFVTFGLLFLTACATQLVQKVDNVSYGYYTKKAITIEHIRTELESVARQDRWELSNQKLGFFIGFDVFSMLFADAKQLFLNA